MAWPRAASCPVEDGTDVGIDPGMPVVETIGAEVKSRFSGHIPKLTVQTR